MAIALDTVAYAKRLREAGFTEQQAEGQAQALAAAMTDSLATKQDLREVELRIEALLADLERRVTFRLGGMIVAGVAVLSVLSRL